MPSESCGRRARSACHLVSLTAPLWATLACGGGSTTELEADRGARPRPASTADAEPATELDRYRERWNREPPADPDAAPTGAEQAPAASTPPAEADQPNEDDRAADTTPSFDWDLPAGFPRPRIPPGNAITAEKVELGRHLFYDERLSENETQSCASCHEQRLAFTDGRTTSEGSTGHLTPRNSMSLANVAYAATLTWSNPLQVELERQAAVPIFGDNPIELGQRSQAELEERLRGIAEYQPLFSAAFPEEARPIRYENVAKALACFQRTLISGRSPFDRWLLEGDESAISDSAKRGFELFNTERFECFHCHVGFNLSDHVSYEDQLFPAAPFHNTGLYNIGGLGRYPEPNTGIFDVTGNAADMGHFKAPTLRNVAVTAPYMHDGSIATLSGVLDHYAAGGRTIEEGPNAGAGSRSRLKSNLIRGFEATEQERADVIAFLESLTDRAFLEDPRFADPWLE